MHHLINFKTKERVKPDNFIFAAADSPYEVVIDLDQVRSKINIDYFKQSPPFVSKYLPLMPIKDYAHFISLKEGATPLIESKKLGKELGIELYFKLESQNPTGSFKDRGSAVEMTIAKELGAKAITVASTGNMAASCSCYAASAGIPCFVFVPEGTPSGKLSQVISYGGHIVQVKGSYQDAARLAEEVARKLGFYLAGDYAYRVEGQKTAAFELVDQLYFNVPDVVIVPMGCGTNITAYAKGFKEYRELGFIEKTPKLIGVQPEGAPSIVKSFLEGKKDIEVLKEASSLASAITVNYALDGMKALDAMYSTGGCGIAVSDIEMVEAQYQLAREESLFVEASSASSFAALKNLIRDGKIKDKRIVCVLTGAGLKDPSPILKVAIKPPTIYPKLDEFMSLYDNSFFKGKTVVLKDKSEIVFTKLPSLDQLKVAADNYFSASYSEKHLNTMLALMGQFLKKGKPLTFSDFQDIVQDAIETLNLKTKSVLKVTNFNVCTAKDEIPTASATINIEGQVYNGKSTGTGPVDAVLNAIKDACGDKVSYSLLDYKVHIRGNGTDAGVYVEMKLAKDGKTSIGPGTSPDIVQASIEAFEKAYNGFFGE